MYARRNLKGLARLGKSEDETSRNDTFLPFKQSAKDAVDGDGGDGVGSSTLILG